MECEISPFCWTQWRQTKFWCWTKLISVEMNVSRCLELTSQLDKATKQFTTTLSEPSRRGRFWTNKRKKKTCTTPASRNIRGIHSFSAGKSSTKSATSRTTLKLTGDLSPSIAPGLDAQRMQPRSHRFLNTKRSISRKERRSSTEKLRKVVLKATIRLPLPRLIWRGDSNYQE